MTPDLSPQKPTTISLIVTGITIYYFTSLIAFAGVSLGIDFIPLQYHASEAKAEGYLKALNNCDGVWYASVARDGYFYDPGRRSNVNFFPAFPLAGRCVAMLTGFSVEMSLVIVANACLCGVFVLLGIYLQERESPESPNLRVWTLLALGLWPVTFFLRMAYSESPFLLLTVLSLYGMHRHWPNWTLALIVGLATACRPVGVALCPVLAWHFWERRRSIALFLWEVPLLFLSAWGLVAFMLYQHVAFGDAFTFNKSQEYWSGIPLPWHERLGRTLILEPIWSKYSPSYSTYWARSERVANPLFSLDFANPLYFLVTIAFVVYGRYRRWIDYRETILAALLILIPYITQGHRCAMGGQARFTAVVLPAYIVMGHLLARLTPPLAFMVLALCAFFLGAYSALFASWHRFF